MAEARSQPPAPSVSDLDAGWAELLDAAAPEPAVPEIIDPDDDAAAVVGPPPPPPGNPTLVLAKMARMSGAREGTGPVLDLRKSPGPLSRPAPPRQPPPPRGEVHHGDVISAETVTHGEILSDDTLDGIGDRSDGIDDSYDGIDDSRDGIADTLARGRLPASDSFTDGDALADETVTQGALVDDDAFEVEAVTDPDETPLPETPPIAVGPPVLAVAQSDAAPVAIAVPAPIAMPRVATIGAGIEDAQPSRRGWLAAVGVVLAVGVGSWWVLRSDGAAPPVRDAAMISAPTEPARAPAPAKQPGPQPEPQPEPQKVAVEPGVVAPVQAAPVPAAPQVPAPSEPAAPAMIAAGDTLADAQRAHDQGRHEDAYAIAERRLELAPKDNDAVRMMALAACDLGDGVRARAAFRRLAGPPIRTEVYGHCRAAGVDVRAKVTGLTAGELLLQARLAAESGDHRKALELARDSNRLQRSADALVLMGISSCRLGDGAGATELVRHLTRPKRRELADGCATAGVPM